MDTLFGELERPARNISFRGAQRSSLDCEYHFTPRGTRRPHRCGHRAFRFRVNHLELSLCLCHAAYMAMRKNVEVLAA